MIPTATARLRGGNYRKHTSANPLQRWLLSRFHAAVAQLLAAALVSLPAGVPRTILDVGCGEGFALAEIRRRLGDGGEEPNRAQRAPAPFPTREGGAKVRTESTGNVHHGQEDEGFDPPSAFTLSNKAPGAGTDAEFTLKAPPSLAGKGDGGLGYLSAYGIDLEIDPLLLAQHLNPAAAFAAAQADALPFRDGAFAAVLCLEVLEHVSNPVETLAELCRAGRGFLVLSVPAQPYFAAANFLRGKNWSTWGDDPEHVNQWTAGAFVRLVSSQATVLQVVRPFPWVVVLARTEDGRRKAEDGGWRME